MSLNEWERANFIQRLQSLQRLCSSSSNDDDSSLSSILVIAGQDGRHNKGSMQIIKYLFTGSVSKELLDGNLDISHDCLEEIVLLIQETSISVILTHEMKNIIGHYLDSYPMVIEYISTVDEENDVDLLQNRKCCDFKRMILESMKSGSGIGIPIPIGYDNNYDIESWPLLRSFALEEVLDCSTGFLTSRFNIFDISEYLEILFRTVDGYCIDSAIDAIKRNILPHTLQTIGILDTITAEQRSRLTADDVIGPLDMLFEFGSIDCAFPPDPSCRPVALFSSDSSILGTIAVLKNDWQSNTAGNSTHVIIEGCEPGSGIRWCRSYFLQKGKYLDDIKNIDSLVDDSIDGIENNQVDMNSYKVTSNIVSRLEAVYVKLWISLRSTVRIGFSMHRDILEAGAYIQNAMDVIMKGKGIEGVDISTMTRLRLDDITLIEKERLQVHMDCLDAFGRIISIEDVDDMGGSCFTYIRVSVSGLLSSDGQECTIAVGDTFIFSPLVINTPLNIPSSPLSSDVSCLSHPIPYYRSFVEKRIEGKSGDKLLACMRNFHLLPSLGLGSAIDTIGSGLLNFDMITDHALIPSTSANIRLFTNGFVIEKMDTTCLPIIVSMLIHVETMWTVSAAEFLKETLKLTEGFVPELFESDGFIIGFKLKTNNTHSSKFKNDTEILGFNLDNMHNQYNMLDRALPSLSNEPTMIAFYVRNDSRGASTLLSTCKEWRQALRLIDIPEMRGVASIPKTLLYSFLHAIDSWHCCYHENRLFDKSSVTSGQDTIKLMDSVFEVVDKSKIKVPYGDISLKCTHMLAEYQRLHAVNGSYSNHSTHNKNNPLCIVFGHAGSGVLHIGSQIVDRVNKRFNGKYPIRSYVLDFSAMIRNETSLDSFIASSIGTISSHKGGLTDFIIVSAIISPINYYQTTDIVDCILQHCNGFLVNIVSAICLSSLNILNTQTRLPSKQEVGPEIWKATTLSILSSDICDMIIAIDDIDSKTRDDFNLLIREINPLVQLFLVTPMNMRLSEEFVDILEEKFTISRSKVDSLTSLRKVRMGMCDKLKSEFTCRISQCPIVLNKYLLSFEVLNRPTVALSANEIFWEISHLIASLKQMFPNASIPVVMTNLWSVPLNENNLKGFKRILEVSSVKLLTEKQYTDGRKIFKAHVDNMMRNKKNEMESVLNGILSVHGIVRVRNRGTAIDRSEEGNNLKFNSPFVYVEACSGSIKVKPVDKVSLEKINVLTVQGILNSTDTELIHSLFSLCYVHRLQPKAFLNRESVNENQMIKIQEASMNVPISDGWCFDGAGYIDGNSMKGTRRRFRPDIDVFVDRYLQLKNQEISEYNNILKQFSHFL